MASNDVELSEEPQPDSAASHNPVLCQPDMTSGHVPGRSARGDDTPSEESSSGKYFSESSIGHLGYTGTSLWIDPERKLALVLLTNRTQPDRANKAIQEVRLSRCACRRNGVATPWLRAELKSQRRKLALE